MPPLRRGGLVTLLEPASPARVVVADDDAVARTLVVRLARQWGLEAQAAADGIQAWAMLEAAAEPVIAILDWMMPGIDGLGLCRRIRATASLAGSHVILLTAGHAASGVVEGLGAGADDFLEKPFDAFELRARANAGLRVLALQRQLALRVRELEAALASVRRLEGLLPICARCKRIRDRQQYWRRVEEYVSAHSEARFSHGLCPECLERDLAIIDAAEETAPEDRPGPGDQPG